MFVLLLCCGSPASIAAVSRGQTRKTFERALTETKQITGVDGDFLLGHARPIAAAAAPDLLLDLPAVDHLPRHVASETPGKIMLDTPSNAVELLLSAAAEAEIGLDGSDRLVAYADDIRKQSAFARGGHQASRRV